LRRKNYIGKEESPLWFLWEGIAPTTILSSVPRKINEIVNFHKPRNKSEE